MYYQNIKITIPSGIHTRFAAMIVSKATEIKSKYKIEIYIKKENFTDWLGVSMLGILALKINNGETISFGCLENGLINKAAIQSIIDYIDKNINSRETTSVDEFIDEFIDESNIANDQVLNVLPIGVIAIDLNENITKINSFALHLLQKNLNDALGKPIKKLIPNSELNKVFASKENDLGQILNLNNKKLIVNRSPLFSHNELIGAIAVIQDISSIIDKFERSEEELNFYKEEFIKNAYFQENKSIIGFSSTLKDTMYISKKASQSTSTVLIRGESGTGKELIAKYIHTESTRRNMPFVRVNCAAIPENLLESELFGHEKGAFTGATKTKPGKFEIANGGTIFLDEIGDMPVSMQVKLLRVLQEMEIERIGALAPQKIDVRVIAATNRNLEDMMSNNTFREDLFYRLNVLSILLPPLRDRKCDIGILVDHFIKKLNKKLSTNITTINHKALNSLESYDFPGNIRELENIIERAINLCNGDIIVCNDLPSYIVSKKIESDTLINLEDDEDILTFEEYEKMIIEAAMKKYKSYNKAGKALGITHRTVSLKCKKYNIDVTK